jgi:hypothetical protein
VGWGRRIERVRERERNRERAHIYNYQIR